MNRAFQWLSLVAGLLLLILGVRNLYLEGDWVIFVLSMLIIAFSISGLLKGKQKI
jgi:uncharacterized membrane protein